MLKRTLLAMTALSGLVLISPALHDTAIAGQFNKPSIRPPIRIISPRLNPRINTRRLVTKAAKKPAGNGVAEAGPQPEPPTRSSTAEVVRAAIPPLPPLPRPRPYNEFEETVDVPDLDGDHLVIQFPGELGFLTLLNFQKYLNDPDTAAHIESGLAALSSLGISPKAADTFNETLSQALAPEAGSALGDAGGIDPFDPGAKGIVIDTLLGGAQGLAGIVPEAGEVTAGGSRDAANTFGDPQFGTPFDLNIFDPGPQARTAPPLPEADQPIIVADEPPVEPLVPTAKSGSTDGGSTDGGSTD